MTRDIEDGQKPAVPRVDPASLPSTSASEERELDSLRDRLGADEIKVTDVLSTTVRTVATGLTLILYTFLTAEKPSPFITAHFDAMRAASALGLFALITDALHYLAALLQIGKTRRTIRKSRKPVTVEFVVAARTNEFYYIRNFFFVLKIALVACGSAVVITALLSTQLSTLTKP